MSLPLIRYKVARTIPFNGLIQEIILEHLDFQKDLEWLEGRLVLAPETMGDHVPGLKGLNLPVFKTRLRDSCCKLSLKEGWRLYYALSKETKTIYLLFLHHKKELENPAKKYLQQKIQRAFSEGI